MTGEPLLAGGAGSRTVCGAGGQAQDLQPSDYPVTRLSSPQIGKMATGVHETQAAMETDDILAATWDLMAQESWR